MMKKRILFIFMMIYQYANSQSLPIELWPVRDESWVRDFGIGWENHSLINPYQCPVSIDRQTISNPALWFDQDAVRYRQTRQHVFSNRESLNGGTFVGYLGQAHFTGQDSSHQDFNGFQWLQHFQFKHVWTQLYMRASTRESGFPGFTPYSRDIARAGMHAGEFDQALVGYTDDHFHFQFGRGRQIWGPDLIDNVMLSGESASYEHFMGAFRYKNWTATFFTGFLETIESENKLFNRYIAGHALQYTNHRNCIVMVGEVTVYYGENRPFDLSYLNPLPMHIETELNRRENIPYDHGNLSNAVYFINVDWLTPMDVRFSGSLLFDEFQLDQKDRDQGRPDAMSGRVRLSKGFYIGSVASILSGKYESVGSYTYRHEKPYTSFMSRDLPLGMPQGSDYRKIGLGWSCFLPARVMFDCEFSYLEQGEKDIRETPYTPFTEFVKIKFPSGNIRTVKQVNINLLYSLDTRIEASLFYQGSESRYTGNTVYQNILGLSFSIHAWPHFSL